MKENISESVKQEMHRLRLHSKLQLTLPINDFAKMALLYDFTTVAH